MQEIFGEVDFWWQFWKSVLCLTFATIISLAATVVGRAQSPPTIVSVTPANGATNVATNSTLVFVFDQNMNTSIFPIGSFPPLFTGNFEIKPTNLSFNGSWGTDRRTLTLRSNAGLPFNTNILWTLNPPAGTNFTYPPLSSASSQAVATVSGSFSTAPPPPPPPKLASVTPPNNATNVPPTTTPIIFVFDQPMETSTALVASASAVGNYQFTPSTLNTQLTGFWSADKRTLTFQGNVSLALGTFVTWRLNPFGTTVSLKSAAGQTLATTNGSFTILATTGGGTNEICQIPTNTSLGRYTLLKSFLQVQTAATQVLASSQDPASFFVLVKSPPTQGPGKSVPGQITNGSLTLPNGSAQVFTNNAIPEVRDVCVLFSNRTCVMTSSVTNILSGDLGVFASETGVAALDSAYPPGSYTLRFQQDSFPERVIPMTMPPTPSVPMISNYSEAQSINATQNFTLRWNAFSLQGTGAFINVVIMDEYGKLIFRAPNSCVPRTFAPTETSVVIPANYLRAGLSYEGQLQFGYNFYSSTNDVPQMAGSGTVERTTYFTIGTSYLAGTTNVTLPLVFTAYRILPNGHPEMNLTGTAGKLYTILRARSLPSSNWTNVGTVTISASGSAVFEDTDGALQFPAFYQAVTN